MRVALVAQQTSHLSDTPGTRRIERVARGLADRGHDVTVFCTQFWQGDGWERTADGVRYRAVTVGESLSGFCLKLPILLARHRPDVVHTRPVPPQCVLAASSGCTLARAPLVVEWYGDESLPEGRRLSEWALTEPRLVVTPSEMVRTAVREREADAEDVRVIPESIDFGRIGDVEPATEVDVAYAHPLDESANMESLLLGLAELRDRDWSARIVGDGPERAAYEQEVADLRIDDRVEFVGACDRAERLSIYRGAHAFVQTAFREYFGRELLWALACGCVGIVEYQTESAAHELIENYERSYRVTSPEQLADAIVDAGEFDRLTSDDTWARYDRPEVAGRYVDAYEDVQERFGWL
jgi:glycosyltransferase involved in cell wall biosynthesis